MEPPTKSAAEAIRTREVRRYKHSIPALQSSGDDARPRKESPDTVLTSFTQLVALRLDVQRAFIALVDTHDQVSPRRSCDPAVPEVCVLERGNGVD